MTSYKSSRDSAEKAFESIRFDESAGRGLLDALLRAALVRYDAEIEWYDTHADRRRVASSIVRGLAVALGTASLLVVNARAFGSDPSQCTMLCLDCMVAATGGAILAGSVLLLDSVFQITTRYARWRVAEYTIRTLRTEFEVEFLTRYGARADEEADLALFNEAKILATERFKVVQDEIKTETVSWQGNLEKAMATLQSRIEQTRVETKKYAEASRDAEQQRKASEQAREKQAEPVLLQVTIDASTTRPTPLALVVRDKRGREVSRKEEAHTGTALAFTLTPGVYVVELVAAESGKLAERGIRLVPNKDAALSI